MDNFLSHLPKITLKRKKRLGRGLGSGKGAKSGRGTTRHQKAREDIPLHFEGGQGKMIKRFPLLRGKGRNKSINKKPVIFYTKDLNQFKDGDIVDIDALITAGLLKEKERKRGVKVLAKGKVEKKITVVLPVSKSAQAMIEKGGSIIK